MAPLSCRNHHLQVVSSVDEHQQKEFKVIQLVKHKQKRHLRSRFDEELL